MKRSYTFDKVKVIDTKAPCLMVMEKAFAGGFEKPVMLHYMGGEVWVSDYDTFMDAGFSDDHRIVPVGLNEGFDESKELRDAWLVYEDICEFGEPGSNLERIERRQMFAALWKYKTGIEIIYKEEF